MWNVDNEGNENRNNGRYRTTKTDMHKNILRKKISSTSKYWKQTP